ncbi:MAG TPA: YggS family pyridoxal phosphate-dependent enzyme [Polyangiaceae bacterium]|nr:YggS family pyridoxal phosphate-dependent enzyme [Polyangiaceae bacterium]
MEQVVQGLNRVREQLARALESCGRAPDAARLIAVSKFQPASAIRVAYAAGQRDFGENYVQELEQKAAELSDLSDLRFHMIGHLQRNKARTVAPLASLIHTVHSLELVRELDKRASGVSLSAARAFVPGESRLAVLVEVNVGGEAQKSGCTPEALGPLLQALDEAKHLRSLGLMCVPPLSADPSQSRPYFERLRRLREEHGGAQRLPELSMGMSADLSYAVAEGASIVRVGTAIFGERPRAEH